MRQSLNRIFIPLLPLLASALAGCEHKVCASPISNTHRVTATRIEASYDLTWEMRHPDGPDWPMEWPDDFGMDYESLNPRIPAGLCVNPYGADGITLTRHLPASGGQVDMSPGLNSVLMYNDDTEFIVFNNLNSSVSGQSQHALTVESRLQRQQSLPLPPA